MTRSTALAASLLAVAAIAAVPVRTKLHDYLVDRTVSQLDPRRVLGQQVFSDQDRAVAPDGREVDLLPASQGAILVFVDATCVACRLEARSYAGAYHAAAAAGTPMIFVMRNDSVATAQYMRLIGAPGAALRVSGDSLFRRLQIVAVPTVFAFDSSGRVLRRWEDMPRITYTGAP